jgi:hypothetical protein
VKNLRRTPLATSCNAVIHIGDSTSEGLVSNNYLPDRRQQISAQYARVGATTQHFAIAGALSTYESFEGEPRFTYADRIDSMMSTIGEEPVLWVNVKSLVTSGPYAEKNILAGLRGAQQADRRRPAQRLPQHAAASDDRRGQLRRLLIEARHACE